jgi:two-component system chemotaxis sensor kinase CheA
LDQIAGKLYLSKLFNIERKLYEILPKEHAKEILREIRELRHEQFVNIIYPHLKYAKKLAERLSKKVEIELIYSINLMVDMERYNEFSKTLVHVFRNIIDHGIEDVEERVIKGKNYLGKIKCELSLSNDQVIMIISDDGNGIDIEKIKKIALEKNLYDENTIERLPEKDLILLILRNNFSTKSELTDISGMGVGLYAMKTELDKIGGKIEIKTKKGLGTEFIFYIPIYK